MKLKEVAEKRADNVDPQDAELDRHIGLEHISPNTPTPDWEPIDGLSSTKRRFQAGDILFAKLRPNLEKAAQPDFDGLCSTDIFPIRAQEGINARWLLYRLSSKPAYDHARRTSVGTRMPRTSWNLFGNLEFGLPPLEEQRKIASVLYNIDQAIQKNREISEKLSQLHSSIVNRLISGSWVDRETRPERVGPKGIELPQDWKVRRVSEISDIKNGNRIVKGHDYAEHETGYPFIRIVDLENGTVSTEDIRYLRKETAEKMTRGIISSEDVYITVTGRVGDAGTVPEELDGARFTDNAAKLYNLSDVSNEYLALYLRSKFGQDEVHRFTVGSTQPKLSMYRVEKMEVIVPTREAQDRIVSASSAMQDVISRKNQETDRLRRLKRGLMQDLLSGEVRTHDEDIEVLPEVKEHG